MESKKRREITYTPRNRKAKYKEDIKVIVDDYQKDIDKNMNEFVKTNYKNQLIKKKSTIPIKIHFSYYDNGKNNIRESVKDFIRNISRTKQEQKEKKYGKTIREKFEINFNTIEHLGINLDNLKIKNKL